MTYDEEPLLTISIYAGDLTSLTHMFDIEAHIVQEGRPWSLLEEALKVLETCAGTYVTPFPTCAYVTVFVGRKTGTEVKPEARIAVATRNGRAGASIRLETCARVHTAVVHYSCDDVVTIVRKVLEVFVRG